MRRSLEARLRKLEQRLLRPERMGKRSLPDWLLNSPTNQLFAIDPRTGRLVFNRPDERSEEELVSI